MSRIYLATSWRNMSHSPILDFLVNKGHTVYDFKSTDSMPCGGPSPTSFSWEEMEANWKSWVPKNFRKASINSSRAASGFLGDQRGMEWADTCVLLLPCGRSAHLEAGYMKGRGKRLIIYIPETLEHARDAFEPDLMYLLADNIVIDAFELQQALTCGDAK